jgi:hypothetical protein
VGGNIINAVEAGSCCGRGQGAGESPVHAPSPRRWRPWSLGPPCRLP